MDQWKGDCSKDEGVLKSKERVVEEQECLSL